MESYVRALVVDSERGGSYNTVMDSSSAYHFLSVYDVPYDSAENSGLSWRYSLDRLPSPGHGNSHIVQVTSSSVSKEQEIQVIVRTNFPGQHGIHINLEHPLVLYVEVRCGGISVSGARVLAELQRMNGGGGSVAATAALELRDTGAGDPDLESKDGVWSKYITRVDEVGLYRVIVKVVSDSEYPAMVGNARSLGPFTRIVKGVSFRVLSIPNSYRALLPPSRILDLSVSVLTSSQQLELRWTAPGSDYDEGRPVSYQLYQGRDPDQLAGHQGPGAATLLESFSAVSSAGGKEVHRITVHSNQVNINLYYILLAADSEGNLGQISNVVAAYMPR